MLFWFWCGEFFFVDVTEVYEACLISVDFNDNSQICDSQRQGAEAPYGVPKRLLWFSFSWQQRSMRLLSHSSLVGWGENQKEKAKLMGCDKKSLTERQREKKITTITPIKIHSMQCSHHLMLSLLLSSKSPSFSQLPT